MSQYAEENDLGGGGGEVNEDTMEQAWDAAAERRGREDAEELLERDEEASE